MFSLGQVLSTPGALEAIPMEVIHSALQRHEIGDWGDVCDFHYSEKDGSLPSGVYGGNVFRLVLGTEPLATGQRGLTTISKIHADGKPYEAIVRLDDNGAGLVLNDWQFILDDFRFTDLVSPFAGSIPPGLADGHDFYRVAAHEIGHALGIAIERSRSPHSLRLALNEDGSPTFPEYLRPLSEPNLPDGTSRLYAISAGETDVVMTEDGHIYDVRHKDDLMNPGIAVERKPIERRVPSDVDARLLRYVYKYDVDLPSTVNTLYASLDMPNGTLRVRGLSGEQSDQIVLNTSGSVVEILVNGTRETFDLLSVASTEVHAGEGNDFVDASQLSKPAVIYGGLGNDILRGGTDPDTIYGGTGFDLVDMTSVANGNTDRDQIYGGAGGDQIFGGVDDDLLSGDGGRDYLDGGAGSDSLHGGQDTEVDTLVGGTGLDYFYPIGNDIMLDYNANEDSLPNTRTRDRGRR